MADIGECQSEALGWSEEDATNWFIGMRWQDEMDAEGGLIRCLKCENLSDVYRLKKGRVLKCRACGHHNRITSGTIFECTKLSMKQCLLATALYWDTHGKATPRDYRMLLGVEYGTANALWRKMKDADGTPFDVPNSRWRGKWTEAKKKV